MLEKIVTAATREGSKYRSPEKGLRGPGLYTSTAGDVGLIQHTPPIHARAHTHTHTHGKLGIALLFTVPRGAALPHQVLTSPLLFFHALPFQEHWDPIPHVPQPVPHRLRGLSGEPVQQQHPVPVHHRQHPAAHTPDGSQSREHHQQHSPQLRLLGDGGQPGQGKQRCVPLGELCVGQPQLGETAGSSGTAGSISLSL